MLFYGISLIMKEKSNASALNAGAGTSVPRPRCVRVTSQVRSCLDPDAFVYRPAFAESHYLFLLNNIYLCNKNELRMQRGIRFEF